jgi:hypothetical protein
MKVFLGITLLMLLAMPISKCLATDRKIFTDDDLSRYQCGNGATKSNITDKNITTDTEKDKIPYSDALPTEGVFPKIQQEYPATTEKEIAEIKNVWASFIKKLTVQDIEGAIEYIVDWRKEDYREAFYAMKDKIVQEASKKDKIEVNQVTDQMATGKNIVGDYS